jgi:hypothetical protein
MCLTRECLGKHSKERVPQEERDGIPSEKGEEHGEWVPHRIKLSPQDRIEEVARRCVAFLNLSARAQALGIYTKVARRVAHDHWVCSIRVLSAHDRLCEVGCNGGLGRSQDLRLQELGAVRLVEEECNRDFQNKVEDYLCEESEGQSADSNTEVAIDSSEIPGELMDQNSDSIITFPPLTANDLSKAVDYEVDGEEEGTQNTLQPVQLVSGSPIRDSGCVPKSRRNEVEIIGQLQRVRPSSITWHLVKSMHPYSSLQNGLSP